MVPPRRRRERRLFGMRNLARRALAVPGLPVGHWMVRRRFQVSAVADALLWALSLAFATYFRFDFRLGAVNVSGLFAVSPLAALLQILFGQVFGLYKGRSRFGSFDEVLTLFASALGTGAALLFVDLTISPRPVPLGAVV